MLYILAFAGGVIVGLVVMGLSEAFQTAHGYFKIELKDEESGLYTVSMAVNNKENLLMKDKIVLVRDFSQR